MNNENAAAPVQAQEPVAETYTYTMSNGRGRPDDPAPFETVCVRLLRKDLPADLKLYAAPVQAQEPKPFSGPGAWFSVNVLGNPMREYAPGKWENCVWPSVAPVQPVAVPVNMVLHCPACGLQHIDAPDGEWANPPHRSHLCHGCKHVWRPADVLTNGVAAVSTSGSKDSLIAAPAAQGDALTEEIIRRACDVLEGLEGKELPGAMPARVAKLRAAIAAKAAS